MAKETVTIELAPGKTLTLESGQIAKQAGGAVIARMGDTMVLCTVCAGEDKDNDFFPLTVDYREKYYAAGKIPGGYFKREAKPTDREVLTSRMIDRPLRPMFPEGYRREIQVICSVISADEHNEGETIALAAASAAIGLSSIPFEEQVACVKVAGSFSGEFIINPTHEELESADIELSIAGSMNSINMVEGSAYEAPEELMVNAVLAGHAAIKKIIAGQNELISRFPVEKDVFVAKPVDQVLFDKVEALAKPLLHQALHTDMLKKAHYAIMKQIKKDVQAALATEFPERAKEIGGYLEEIQWRDMREMVLSEKRRIDGRGPEDVRPIEIMTSYLPRASMVRPNPIGTPLDSQGDCAPFLLLVSGPESPASTRRGRSQA
jgi:polyribonucleotide nucleotidyltransferase